jgi:lipase
MSEPLHHLISVNQIQLSVYEWGKSHRGHKPTLVLTHATGFHGRCWDQVISHLPGYHVIAVDQRGHGHSSKTSFDNWHTFGEDLKALLEALDVSQAIGVGHSMGGHASVVAASLNADLFSQLVLIDPVIMPPDFYAFWNPEVLNGDPHHPAARRRNQFDSVTDVLSRYQERAPYSLFTAEALRDYFEHGVVDNPQGEGVVLACPPAFEARIYDSVFSNQTIIEAVGQVQIPVTVVRAMQAPTQEELVKDFRYSPTWPELANSFSQGTDMLLSELTHFMPMQAPDVVAGLIKEAQLVDMAS